MSRTKAVVAYDNDLVQMLDPQRDYGDRTYEQVVEAIQSGIVTIEPGHRLPVLFNTQTRRAIKGTGQPPQTGVSIQQSALRDFRARALDDMPAAYDLLMKGMLAGDPRYDKIYWENLMGKMGENRGGDAMAEAFKALITAMQRDDTRTITLEQ